ncbi:HDOD domain-containing protein [Litoribacillus peritrichatus]|uniref:HDOD domain-containing protein n=1 Tax=Litoribacillus peritrichatus TaxID=718191 RepID=A0ABP7MDB0_9GAMM
MLKIFRIKKRKERKRVSVDEIKELYPINALTPQHQILITAKSKRISLKKGAVIAEAGSTDDFQYYLLSGKIKLIAQDGKSKTISSSSEAATHPIANLQPRRYKVIAKTKITILVTSRSILSDYFDQAKELLAPERVNDNYTPILSTTPIDSAVRAVLDHFENDVDSGRFVLPSIPEVAHQIVEILDDPDANATKIARKVSLDSAIAIKLVNAANSPLFKGVRDITSSEDAIVRLGLKTAKDLIKVFAVRDLYQSNTPEIQKRLRSHWNISKQVAAIAYVLSKLNKTSNPNEALLAGAVHNIGVVPALLYAEHMPEVLERYDLSIDEFVNKTKTKMGVYMLKHWEWPQQLVDVVAHAENWKYQSGHQAIDMTDIVIVANAHLNILRKFLTCPPLPEITSFSKLSLKLNLTPEKSIKILVNARKEIQSVASAIAFPS